MLPILETEYNDYAIDYNKWNGPHPFGLSGCFRIRNDAEFMVASILSHLPFLDEVVIALQPSEDNSREIAYKLAQYNPRIRVYEYPVIPHFIDHPAFKTDPENSIYSFVHLSNWALSKCQFSWIAKTEGDVICLPTFNNIKNKIYARPDEMHYYGRVILNVAGRNIDQVSQENPRNGGWDEAVFNNHQKWSFIRNDRWEQIDVDWSRATCEGWSALHTKRCKADKAGGWNGEHYIPYERDQVRRAVEVYNDTHGGYPGPDDPLGADVLFKPGMRNYIDKLLESGRLI